MLNSDSTYSETSHPLPPASPSSQKSGLKIKIMPNRVQGQSKQEASGSEYAASEPTSPAHDQPEKQSKVLGYQVTSRGRKTKAVTYHETTDNDDDELYAFSPTNNAEDPPDTKPSEGADESADDEDEHPPRRLTRRSNRNLSGFIVEDEEDKPGHRGGYKGRRKQKRTNASRKKAKSEPLSRQTRRPPQRTKSAGAKDEDDQYVDEPTSPDAEGDTEEEDVEEPMDTSDLEIAEPKPEPEPEPEQDEDTDGKHYALRQRQKINYAIPPPLEEMPRPQPKMNGVRNGGGRMGYVRGRKGPGWSATGAELGRWMGMGADDSDSDYPTRTPRKQPFGPMAPFNGAMGAGGMLAGDLTAGTPSNLGRVGDAALADADPLGVNQNVTFDEVGGLDDHIHSLKEMTLLPLLYPDVFQMFNVTPPRGVLFHGPPGTGKTLLARALAASCRSNGRSISFFMRKGADCLSKWVGEAERQLRLLFEEAKNSQPSIIFFDEIDGLAPVRSSKQDQIHASIVSTLLALMDGMDGRGQVVVIGATNRPDAVDPALRRPGRFDREFYFPLPGLEAREKILSIMTKGWEGWGEGEGDKAKERIRGLARLTKGYGGADLRALCTEAALNAIQRRYPQIYKSTERLLLKPEAIDVQLRDFMISIKRIVPSSARSSTSVATPLPQQFVSVLGDVLEKVRNVINKVLPLEKKLSALEEAEFEDEGEDGALDREMLSQSMQTLRVHRPRIAIYGPIGMGQNYVGAAALHHLEGYHIQSLELGTLLGDSTRTVEAAIVQLFVEAKRHQPSIIYIPSLISWCAAISQTSRSTVRAMLDTLSPTEPILLLAIVDGKFSDLPRDVKQWFGHMKENRIAITTPTVQQREEFFAPLIQDIRRPPTQFPDGIKRRKRNLEELPVAPPVEPRKPTAAELAVQYENDQRTITLLKYRLGPILTDLKRKFKRFTKRASEEYNYDFSEPQVVPMETTSIAATTTTVTTSVQTEMQLNGIIEIVDQEQQQQIMINGHGNPEPMVTSPHPPPPPGPQLHDTDLEKMHVDLYKGRYLTPQDFLNDVEKIVWNAEMRSYEDMDRLYKAQAMLTAAQVSIQEFDPLLKLECERMAVRERQRREEHRRNKEKEREKEKEKEREETANGIRVRRSTRNTGQTLEISITDPVKLERRLKRQRGESAGSSHGEEDEHASGQERDSKRSRMSTEDEERTQLNANVQDGFPIQNQAQRSVHFANEVVQSRAPVQMMVEPPTSLPPVVVSEPDGMVIDNPYPRTGFDPALLNPLPPSEDVFPRASRRGSPIGSRSPQSMASQTLNHLLNPPLPTEFVFPSTTNDNPFFVPQPAPSNQVVLRTPSPRPRTPDPTSEVPAPSPNLDSIETTIIDQRSASPPLPDFHVDDELLGVLRRQLVDSTAPLTIEQLEQLRATCLGNVWRHRTEWNRDELIRELLQNVKEFVEDVNDLEWNDTDDS